MPTSAAGSSGRENGSCPYVNQNDPRCGTRFSLGRIEQAFSVCFGAYFGCPMFHRLNRESAVGEIEVLGLVELTISTAGARHERALPLRATGA